MNHNQNYTQLALMFVLHFIAMYILMYAMVDTFAHVHLNHNQFYMALLMAAPMLILELLFMRAMYQNKKLNAGILVAGVILLVSSFLFIRQQVAIGDEQFLKSMIPHHAGAVLMCEQAPITDPEIEELCTQIISSQMEEIRWMESKLDTLR